MKKQVPCIATFVWILFSLSALAAGVVLPKSLRLAGPLNSAKSQFGDDFANFPFGEGGGSPPIRGWIAFDFSPPVDDVSSFVMTFNAVAEDVNFSFVQGQFYNPRGFGVYHSGVQVSKGKLNVKTGEITDLEVHGVFHNTVIHQSARNNRFPFASSRIGGRLSPLNSDYPPIELPITLPYSERPKIFTNSRFIYDSSNQIIGFDFSGESFTPVTILARTALFPSYSFGDNGQFYFASPDGCKPETPPDKCITAKTKPEGFALPLNAFLHPNLAFYTEELREVPKERVNPACITAGTAQAAAAVVGGRLYRMGGFDGKAATNQVDVYDQSANKWSPGEPMPVAALDVQAAVAGNSIYVVGGRLEGGGPAINTIQVFDTAAGKWSLGTPLPVAVSEAATAGVASKIYVIGGRAAPGTSGVTSKVQIYDSISKSWSEGTTAPLATAGSGVATVGADIYVINGATTDNSVTNRVFIYNTVSNSWREGPKTQRGIYQGAAGYINNRIYLVGGRLSVGGPVDAGDAFFNQQRMQVFESILNDWTLGLEEPIPIASAAAAVLNGEFYVIGGRIGMYQAPGTVTDATQVYSPALGWVVCDSHPVFTGDTVVNAASLAAGPVELSPGSRASIIGFNFSSELKAAPLIRFDKGFFSSDLPTKVNGISITVDGKPAPILSVGPKRVDFIIPTDVQASSTRRNAVLGLFKDGSPSQTPQVEVPVVSAAPGIFIYSHDETRAINYLNGSAAVAYNRDGTLLYISQPAHSGDVVTLYATGLGPVNLTLEVGQRAPDAPPNQLFFTPKVTIGDTSAQVVSARLAPNFAGVFELKVVVPANVRTGNSVPVQVEVNGIKSNTAVITIR